MTISYLAALRDTMLNTLNTALGTSALIKIYDGSVPASVNAGLGASVLLATLTGNVAGFSTGASSQTLTAAAITGANAVATGTATYFRACNSGGTAQCQGSVTVAGGGGDIQLTGTAVITSGLPVSITSLVITEGNP